MKTTQLLFRLALTCLLALPATFVFGQAPASIVGKKLILKSATNDYLTLAPVSSDTVWHYTREYDSEYGLWESSTYTWQSAGDTATVQMFFGALNLTFTSPSAGTFTNPFSSGTFEMSEDPADSSPPFDKYFSDDFTDLEKSNSIWPFRHSQSENGIVAKQANGTFTLTGTANIGHRWFYNGQQASLLSIAKDWIVSGASFARGTAPSAAKIAIQTSGNPPGGYVEVAIGASNRPPSVAGSAHWYAEVPWESFSGNGVPGGGTDGVYRIRHAASEKTFHCESHDGTSWVPVMTFNWHTGAYALLGDLPSGITSRNGQVDSWVSLEGQYVQPVMSFYLPSGSNVADDQLGFSGFSVTGEGDEPGLPETPETPQNDPVSATIEIISELVNFHEAIDNDTGSEIDFSNVQLTRYDLASTELGFTGDLSIGPGVPDGVFTGTVDYSDTESLDGNGNGISDFFEKELAASVIVNGSATWRAGSYYINYDLSNSSFTKAAGGYDFVLTRAYVKQSTNIPSAFGLNQDGFDFVTPVTPAQAKGSFVYGQGAGSYETDLELKGSLLSGTIEAAGAMSVNGADSVTLNGLAFPSLGDSQLAGLNPLFGQDIFTDSITLTRQGNVYHAQKRVRGILYYVKLSGIPDSDGDGILDLADEDTPSTLLSKEQLLRWEFETESSVWSSPALGADGTVYVGSYDNKVYALNPDGTKKWEFETGDSVPSSPAVGTDGTVYVGSWDNKVYALDGKSGAKKWEFPTGNRVWSSPAIGFDGAVYVGSVDNKVYALKPDGSKKWEFETEGDVYSSPVIGADGTVYVGAGYPSNKVYALNPDGSKKWEFPTGYWVSSSPAIAPDGTVYIGSDDNKVYALNPDGSKKWEFPTGGDVRSSPAIASDGTVYVGSWDNKVYALNPDGSKKWEFATGSYVDSSPALGADGAIYVGSWDNKVYALNPDGSKKWEFPTGGDARSSPAIAFDGTVYVGSWDNKVYALNSDSKGPDDSPWPMFRQNASRTGRALTEQADTAATGTDLGKALANAGTDRGNGWREADWFGFYFPTSSGWHYHAEHGWIYPVGETLDSIWFWDLDLGWCWTSRTVYPYVYRHDPEGWLRYLRESKNPRRFYDFAANAWTSVFRQEEVQGEQSDSSSNKAGDTFTVADLSLEMLWVEPGTFTMGSPSSETGRSSGETQRQVTLTNGFWLGKYEVTQAQWEKVMGSNPSYFNEANRPVEQVSWNDVTSFCEKLTEQESEAGRLPAGMAYQLPTEAQWEYACRAGTTTAYSFGAELTSDQANISGGPRKTTDVGKYPANAWGFHDMHGNVWEWCADRYGDYPTGAATDPVGPADGSSRVPRGGSWNVTAYDARSAVRLGSGPARSFLNLGFRLSLRPTGK